MMMFFKLIVVVVRIEVAVFAKLERRRVEEKLKQETIQAMKNNESNIKEKGLENTFMNRIMLQAAKNKLLSSRLNLYFFYYLGWNGRKRKNKKQEELEQQIIQRRLVAQKNEMEDGAKRVERWLELITILKFGSHARHRIRLHHMIHFFKSKEQRGADLLKKRVLIWVTHFRAKKRLRHLETVQFALYRHLLRRRRKKREEATHIMFRFLMDHLFNFSSFPKVIHHFMKTIHISQKILKSWSHILGCRKGIVGMLSHKIEDEIIEEEKERIRALKKAQVPSELIPTIQPPIPHHGQILF